MTTSATDLGLCCPVCNGTSYKLVEGHWNIWECSECTTWSSINEGQMEMCSKEQAGEARTEFDVLLDRQDRPTDLDWHKLNKAFCDILHGRTVK